MDAEGLTDAGSSSKGVSTEPHEMRITDHGKIRTFVSFALKYLQENPQRPLVLHTLPSTRVKPAPKQSSNAQPQIPPIPESDNEGNKSPSEEPPRKKRKLAVTTATIPRLVSVVEIIKREYGKWALARQTSNGVPFEDSLRMGLHQYNELSTLEHLVITEPQEHEPDDAERLRQVLGSKNFLKQKFTPHLKVTLSVGAQPELEEKGATHQPPQPVKKSKSARVRERKRQKKKEAEEMVKE